MRRETTEGPSRWFLISLTLLTLSAAGLVAGMTDASSPDARTGERTSPSSKVRQEQPELRWYRGNLHAHSLWSDGDAMPEAVVDWFRDAGYHFVALTEHDTLVRGARWIDEATVSRRAGPDHLAKTEARFGRDSIERRKRGDRTQIRLGTLDELRKRFERPGEFLLLSGEEITGRVDGRPAHVSALNLVEPIAPQGGRTITESLRRDVAAVRQQGKRTNRPTLAIVNHPNFHFALNASAIAESGANFVEVFNGHPSTLSEGDSTHPSAERLWDIANALRLSRGEPPIYGLAVDDSHAYHGRGTARPGRGWVMVRAAELSADAVLRSLGRGDFYASSGVRLTDVRFDPHARTLSVRVDPAPRATYSIRFLGTRREALEQSIEVSNRGIGEILAEFASPEAEYRLKEDELYVRAVVTSSEYAARAPRTQRRQRARAWTQPVGWTTRML